MERKLQAVYKDGVLQPLEALPLEERQQVTVTIPRRNSAPSDAPAENSFRIPSTNTPGFAASALRVLSLAGCLGVDFFDGLFDLDWGSWEGSLPESSSLGGEGKSSPRRLLHRFSFLDPGFKISLQDRLYQLCAVGDILITIDSWR